MLVADSKHASTDSGDPSDVMGRVAEPICSSANRSKSDCVKNIR